MSTKSIKDYLFVLPNDSPGGAEQVLKMIASFVSDKNNAHIYILKRKTNNYWNSLSSKKNIKIYYGKSNSEHIGLVFLPLKITLKKFDYIFTSHVLITGFIGFLRRLKIIRCTFFIGRESTTIFTRFSGLKLWIYKTSYFLGYRSLNLLICQTNFMKKDLKKNLPKLAKKIPLKTIANPIDEKLILEKSNDDFSFTESNESYIVSAGRLIDEKGFDILIEAFNIIKKQYQKTKLLILGEGKKRFFLQNLINEKELQNHVKLKGFVKNVYPYFKNANMCVVSSRVEGFPNVLLQMMSQNTKIISTLCADGIDQLKGVHTVETQNHKKLAQTILNIFEKDTSENRNIFNYELKNRSIDNFLKQIEIEL